ncbi:MAG: hypothetical protein U9N30_09055 [Campylobacterota bacterium]|nr:hypothetical protein [Campylobacterota bacterium]
MINAAEELIDFDFDTLLYNDDEDFFDIDSFKINTSSNIQIDFSNLSSNQKIDHLIKTFFSSDQFSPEMQNTLRHDIDFKKELLLNVQQRMKRIINDSSVLYFKEIITVISLLGLGKKYIIFNDYSDYDEETIAALFRDYESFLIGQHESNMENFELTFKYYVTLLEAFNEICIINSTDIRRKRTIRTIIDHLTQSINLLKFQVHLDDNKIKLLNIIQGKFLLYYTHVPFFNTEDKSIDFICKEFQLNLEKQCDGYFLIQSSYDEHKHDKLIHFQQTLLSNASYLILTLIKKIGKIEHTEISLLCDIIALFNKECFAPKQIDLISFSQLQHDLTDFFAYVYSGEKDSTSENILQYIHHTQDIDIKNSEILQNIILFSNNISQSVLENILSEILNIPKYKNDYHEYFKLKIIDIIVLRIIDSGDLSKFESIIQSISTYTQNNNIASHLMSLYAKFYLNAALFYSKLSHEYIEKAQEQYFIFEQISGKFGFANEYQSIIAEILVNHGKQYAKKLSINHELDEDKLTDIAISMIYSYDTPYQDLIRKHAMNSRIAFFIQSILSSNYSDIHEITHTVGQIISNNIFFGLANVSINGFGQNNSTFEDAGYETISDDLIENCKIQYQYPYAYKKQFMELYEENQRYIEQNIANIISSYVYTK